MSLDAPFSPNPFGEGYIFCLRACSVKIIQLQAYSYVLNRMCCNFLFHNQEGKAGIGLKALAIWQGTGTSYKTFKIFVR